MIQQTDLAGTFTFPGTSMTVHRMGYGAMQLAGPGVFGPPRDAEEAIAVLREAVASGVNHIDTSEYYGPHVTNQLIKRALHPYPDGLVIVTKLGARRGDDASWIPAHSRQELIDGVHDNLRNLGLDHRDIVNLRVGGVLEPSEGSIEEPLTVLADLKRQGLIRHIGLSNVTPTQFAEGQRITEIVCVQNLYNLAHRNDDDFIDDLATKGIAYVPFFPLGGFTPPGSANVNRFSFKLEVRYMNELAPNNLSQVHDPTCSELLGMAEHELTAFFGAVAELFGSEQAELSAEDWLDELLTTKTLPASTCDWRLITFTASTRLASRHSRTTPVPTSAELEPANYQQAIGLKMRAKRRPLAKLQPR